MDPPAVDAAAKNERGPTKQMQRRARETPIRVATSGARSHGNQRRHNPGITIQSMIASSGRATQITTSQHDSRGKEKRKIFRMPTQRVAQEA
jgi:hypothetical protein